MLKKLFGGVRDELIFVPKTPDEIKKGYIGKFLIKRTQTMLILRKGSVINDFEGDTIVNAANTGCVYGGGIDGAINAVGGQQLIDSRLRFISNGGIRCPIGESKITLSYAHQKTKYIIHAVGPDYSDITDDLIIKTNDELLASAYKSVLDIGQINTDIPHGDKLIGTNDTLEKRLFTNIGFCLISAAIFRGAQYIKRIIYIGINSIIANVYEGLEQVHIFAFTPDEINTFKQIYVEIITDRSDLTDINKTLDKIIKQTEFEIFDEPMENLYNILLYIDELKLKNSIKLQIHVLNGMKLLSNFNPDTRPTDITKQYYTFDEANEIIVLQKSIDDKQSLDIDGTNKQIAIYSQREKINKQINAELAKKNKQLKKVNLDGNCLLYAVNYSHYCQNGWYIAEHGDLRLIAAILNILYLNTKYDTLGQIIIDQIKEIISPTTGYMHNGISKHTYDYINCLASLRNGNIIIIDEQNNERVYTPDDDIKYFINVDMAILEPIYIYHRSLPEEHYDAICDIPLSSLSLLSVEPLQQLDVPLRILSPSESLTASELKKLIDFLTILIELFYNKK